MGQTKRLLDDYLTNEEFDLMFDDEYEMYLEQKKVEQSAYEEMLADSQGFNNFAQNN